MRGRILFASPRSLGTSSDPLRGELPVELPSSALLHEAPDDDEPRGAGVVHEGDIHGGRGRRPRDLVDGQGVDRGAPYLVGLLARDPNILVVLASKGGAEVRVGLL